MAAYMGIEPAQNKPFHFVSYKTEDAERVSQYVVALAEAGMNMWYDYGIPYDSKWRGVIAEKINECESLLLFYCNAIVEAEDSYVITEYEIARRLKKRIIVVQLDA